MCPTINPSQHMGMRPNILRSLKRNMSVNMSGIVYCTLLQRWHFLAQCSKLCCDSIGGFRSTSHVSSWSQSKVLWSIRCFSACDYLIAFLYFVVCSWSLNVYSQQSLSFARYIPLRSLRPYIAYWRHMLGCVLKFDGFAIAFSFVFSSIVCFACSHFVHSALPISIS